MQCVLQSADTVIICGFPHTSGTSESGAVFICGFSHTMCSSESRHRVYMWFSAYNVLFRVPTPCLYVVFRIQCALQSPDTVFICGFPHTSGASECRHRDYMWFSAYNRRFGSLRR